MSEAIEGLPVERLVGRDPTCGNCGKKRSAHYHESYGRELRRYCFTHTTGDVFTGEPGDDVVLAMLIERMPETYDELVAAWKAENGHEPNDQRQARRFSGVALDADVGQENET